MSIGERIYKLRDERRLSQDELADRIGVSRQTISNWETDKVRPDTDKLLTLCKEFDVSADYLLFGKEEIADIPKRESRPALFLVLSIIIGVFLIAALAISIILVSVSGGGTSFSLTLDWTAGIIIIIVALILLFAFFLFRYLKGKPPKK